MLAMSLRTALGVRFPALSLTTIVSMLASTEVSEPDGVPEWVVADMVDEACA